MNRMSVKEFIEFGYLHEVNRRVLHPLGLALEVVEEADGRCSFSGVQDFRDDPEGMVFAEDTLSFEKADRVAMEEALRLETRHRALGFWVQPVPGVDP